MNKKKPESQFLPEFCQPLTEKEFEKAGDELGRILKKMNSYTMYFNQGIVQHLNRETNKKSASVTLAIPDTWAEDLMQALITKDHTARQGYIVLAIPMPEEKCPKNKRDPKKLTEKNKPDPELDRAIHEVRDQLDSMLKEEQAKHNPRKKPKLNAFAKTIASRKKHRAKKSTKSGRSSTSS